MTSPIRNAMTLPSFDAKWALARIMDGLKPHDLPYMTGLPESDCERIWAVYTALAEQQGEGPSDEELLDLMPQQFRDDLDSVSRLASYSTPVEPGIYRVILNRFLVIRALSFARAILARWGHPAPQPPAEGEVAEIAAWLRAYSDCEFGPHSEDPDHRGLYRAAELLQQQHPTPVPVSDEPWKREGWCDEDGFCWFGWAAEPYLPPDASWSFCMPSEREYHSVSLPARALPLPQGEVE